MAFTSWINATLPEGFDRLVGWLVGWLGFYGISTSEGYLMSNLFLYRQFSLAWVHNLSKTFLFQAIQFSQTILIQPLQFSVSIDFVYTQLNVKTVLY